MGFKLNLFVSMFLSRQFQKLGETVASHPSYFILVPVFITLILCTGVQRLKLDFDVVRQVTPDGAKFLHEREKMKILFPKQVGMDYFPGRDVVMPHACIVTITPRNGKSLFTENVFKDILFIDKVLRNVTIEAEDRQWGYEDLCAKSDRRCLPNNILALAHKVEDIIAGNYSISYPVSFTRNSFLYYGQSLGGVELNENNKVIDADAAKLFYVLKSDTKWEETLASRWEIKFLETLESFNLESVIVDGFIKSSFDIEMKNLLLRILLLLPFSVIAVIVFSAVTCLSVNWVCSKPWTGVIASLSAGLAMGSGFGLVMYCGVPFIVGVLSMGFILIGIGMDDTFVLLAAWRRTDPKKSVAERMGVAYKESSMAITITSLTNFIAFVSGTTSLFQMVRVICIYASVSIFFGYIYQLTFVGALMSICGYAEEQNRHALTFQRIPQGYKDPGSKLLTRFFPRINSDIWGSIGDVLNKWSTKCIALVVMVSYLSIGFWGITKANFIGNYQEISPFDSPLFSFLEKESDYFHRYRIDVQIIIDEELNYADPSVQTQIEQLFSKIENNVNMADSSVTESWLRYYLKFLEEERMSTIISSYNLTDTNDFNILLRKLFLRIPAAKRFQQDVTFNHDNTSIISSRFVCRVHAKSVEDFVNSISYLREMSKKSQISFFTYSFQNYAVDEVKLQVPVTLQSLSAVTAGIFVVCLISLPDVIAVLCVTCTVVMIDASVLGYISLWSVHVGPVIMILLVLCSGLAVDYVSHFANDYVRNDILDPKKRLRTAISCVGMPIFQGSASTIISALPLIYPVANTFFSVFKVILLISLFSLVHALVFFPIILSTIQLFLIGCRKHSKRLNQKEEIRFTEKGVVNRYFQNDTSST